RTALTAGVLFIGIVISVAFGLSLRNNIRDIYNWCNRNVGHDFIIRGIMPDTTTILTAAPVPEELADRIAELPGVENARKIAFVLARVQDRPAVAISVSVLADQPLPIALDSGDEVNAVARLGQGEVILGSPLAQRLGVGIGDMVRLESRHGTRSVRVAGTTTEYTVGGMALYLDWKTGKELFDMPGPHAFAIKAAPGAGPALAERLKTFCAQNGLKLQSH